MAENIPPTTSALQEALVLSDEILRNVELSEPPLSNIVLKTMRLARLLNDFDHTKIFYYEANGYPLNPDGLPQDIWRFAGQAGRQYLGTDKKTYAYAESVLRLEQSLLAAQNALSVAKDPDVSVSSANPNQFVMSPMGNWAERKNLLNEVATYSKQLAERRTLIYSYALARHYELKFSGAASDIFSRHRETIDPMIGQLVPDALQRFSAIQDNLRSTNSENWSNAVHSCRRILQDLANSLFPPSDEERMVATPEGKRQVKLGPDNYINRLKCYVEDHSSSHRFLDLVGSHLGFLGDRLEAVFRAAQKGSHTDIVSRKEADRYVVYTYLIVGDILGLHDVIAAAAEQVTPPDSDRGSSGTPLAEG